MDTAYIWAITIDNMPITVQLLHIIDIFLGRWKLLWEKATDWRCTGVAFKGQPYIIFLPHPGIGRADIATKTKEE